jgi:membrane-associated phospholipid phosphatase
MSSTEAPLLKRLRLLCINALVFVICYEGASRYAANRKASVRIYSLAFDFESDMPFIPWMLVPYMTLWIVFAASFLCIKSPQALQTHHQRTLLATVMAGVFFVCFPTKFSPELAAQIPIITMPLLSVLQEALLLLDHPFNQFPSLHVAYAALLFSTLAAWVQNRRLKLAVGMWLCLSALSTVLVYQHHILDIVGGLGLAGIALRTVVTAPQPQKDPPVAFYYLMASGCCAVLGALILPVWLTLYICCSLCLVSLAYYRLDRDFLRKRNGQHKLWIRALYAPYLIGYFCTWQFMRWHQNKQHKPAFTLVTPQLWVGRCLKKREALLLPSDCSVIDVSPELQDCLVTTSKHYIHIPILDIISIPNKVLDECVQAIHHAIASNQTVYLHCAMGFSRSQAVAKHYLRTYSISSRHT